MVTVFICLSQLHNASRTRHSLRLPLTADYPALPFPPSLQVFLFPVPSCLAAAPSRSYPLALDAGGRRPHVLSRSLTRDGPERHVRGGAIRVVSGRRLAAAERRQEGLAEARVHEAVGDGVAAGGAEAEQVAPADAGAAQRAVHGREVVQRRRVDDVQRRPAHEELEHHHEQHLDDAPLAGQRALGVAVPQPQRRRGVRARPARRLQRLLGGGGAVERRGR